MNRVALVLVRFSILQDGKWLWWFIALNVLFILPFQALAAVSEVSENKLTALRNFLSNPPAIKEALFVLREYPDMFRPGTRTNNGYRVTILANPTYRARWQADAFMFSQTNADSAMVSVGGKQREPDASWACGFYSNSISSSNICWYAKPKEQVTYYYGTVGPQTQGLWVPELIYKKRNSFFAVIGMGIADLQPGTLKWSGLRFDATNSRGAQITGDLYVNPDEGVPRAITYRVAGMPGQYVVDLGYASISTNSLLPDQFKRTHVNGSPNGDTRTTEVLVMILALETTLRPLPLTDFQYDLVYAKDVGRIYTLDSGGLGYIGGDGKPRRVRTPYSAKPSSIKKRNYVIVLMGLALLVPPFVLMLRFFTTRSREKNQEPDDN